MKRAVYAVSGFAVREKDSRAYCKGSWICGGALQLLEGAGTVGVSGLIPIECDREFDEVCQEFEGKELEVEAIHLGEVNWLDLNGQDGKKYRFYVEKPEFFNV